MNIQLISYFTGEKRDFMNKKNKKEKRLKCCIDCEKETDDHYPVFSNKGTIHRCVQCYELWLNRSTRYNAINTGQVKHDVHVDQNDPNGRFDWN